MPKLERGKHELERVIEELHTADRNLKDKTVEASRINLDLQNLMASTDVGTIFLDNELRVKLYTSMIERIFHIGPDDIGRQLEHLTTKLDSQDIAKAIRKVANRLVPFEREIRDSGDRWYLMRIVPYRTSEEKVEGTVITFIDISNRLEAEKKRLRWLATVVESSHDAIFSFAFDRKIVTEL